MALELVQSCDSSCESGAVSTVLGVYPLCMQESVNTIVDAIEGLSAYIPAMRELFNTPPHIKIDNDLDYQGRLHWGFVAKKESDSGPYYFNVCFYPRVKAASECSQMIETVIDLSSDIMHSSARKHGVETTCLVFIALARILALKTILQSILKDLFNEGTEVIEPCLVKELMTPIMNPVSIYC